MAVHKFDMKRALADIQSVDHGDVTEIISIHPSVRSAGRSTPVSAAGSSRHHSGELRSSSPRVTGVRIASAIEDRQSVSSPRHVLKASTDLSKSYEELDGITPLEGAETSNHVTTAAVPESSARTDRKLDETVKRTSASEENLLSSEHRLSDVTDIKQLARLQEESESLASVTRKPSYHKDDHAMHPIYGCPENYGESLSMPKTTFPEIFNGLLFQSIL